MSRVAKKPIIIPEKTTVTVDKGVVSVKGPKGEMSRTFRPGIGIVVENNQVTLTLNRPEDAVLWGTYASHVRNMVQGVSEGFEKKLVIEGIGFKSDIKGNELTMSLGYSHPVNMTIPSNLTVTADKNIISVSGVDKEAVGEFAASIRAKKKPEPYKGKGIRYDTEVIRRKQGKKAA